jgi:hypothetical protein
MASPRTRRPTNRRRGGGVFPLTSDEESITGETKADQLVRSKEDPKGKEKKRNKKKALKGNKVAVKSGAQEEGESTASLTSKQGKQAAPDLLSNPEAKGRGLVNDERTETESMPRSKKSSRGECSGQKKPDS